MKKLTCLFLCFLVSVSSIIASADFKEGSSDYTSIVNTQIENVRLYEKSIEAKQSGVLEWYPFPEGDFDAEYGEEFQLGKSDSPSSFTYYYDIKRGYLIQYFNINGEAGVLIWDEEVPISYEEFN